ncbi:hypothetical protein FACS189468_5590 [Spirochaetia bacterium]|nr:hypothetical protein FACS189468_5590 [Spirochaetia bacterium]
MKTVEEKIEFANGINFDGLFRHAEIFSGMALAFEKPEVRGRRGDVHIEFKSNDIAASCGIFGKILEYCVIDNFSNSVFEDKETGKLKYWVNVHLSYQHHDGGSNGMDLFTAWYGDGEWTFRDVKPRT